MWSWISFAIGYGVGAFSAIFTLAVFFIGARNDGVDKASSRPRRRDNVVPLPTVNGSDESRIMRPAE